VSLPEPDRSPATILDTDASHCLYRFVNNDSCEPYTPQDPAILSVIEHAEALGLKPKTERLTQGRVAQTVLTIDFPDAESLQQFEQSITPLPLQFKYEGELSAGFQFLEAQEADDLSACGMVAVPNATMLSRLEPDPSFTVVSHKTSALDIESVHFTTHDHSYARFTDLVTIDIDRPLSEVAPHFEQRCNAHPNEVWAMYSTRNGVHAMRLDTPQTPNEAMKDADFFGAVGADQKYLSMAQATNGWTARY
ncbi:MAG: hypothetical protein AAFQ57_14910, partial [Cyanobacteria bacterium J06626_14]